MRCNCTCEVEHAAAIARAKAEDMSLSEQIEDEDIPVDLVVRNIRAAGGAEIEATDGEPAALNGDDALWVVSEHTLMVAGEKVASWTRCAVGRWGGNGGPGTRADAWDVEEDTEGGDSLPDRISEILDALDLEDEIPSVPEPASADEATEEDTDGEWCVYWSTRGDDARVVARYSTEDEAQAVCDEHDRKLRAANPGDLLCGYEVRHLVDGEWVREERD